MSSSPSFSSSDNDNYKNQCIYDLPIHIRNAVSLCIAKPVCGYKQVIRASDYKHLTTFTKFSKNGQSITHFEILFLGYAIGDILSNGIIPINRAVCGDESSRSVFFSNFLDQDIISSNTLATSQNSKNSSVKEVNNSEQRKYVVAEVSCSPSMRAAERKVFQIERSLHFLMEKTASLHVENCAAIAVIVGPSERLYTNIKKYFSYNEGSHPLIERLLSLGRLLFIENTNTLWRKVEMCFEDANKKLSDLKIRLSRVESVLNIAWQISMERTF
jgi:hypothetical protein